jgi:hypothetical protein
MGNLIKQLSAECAALSEQLKNTNVGAVRETKPSPAANESTIWRRVISRLQEEPQ